MNISKKTGSMARDFTVLLYHKEAGWSQSFPREVLKMAIWQNVKGPNLKCKNDKDITLNVKKLLHILTNYGMLYSNKVHGLRLVDMKEELNYGIL